MVYTQMSIQQIVASAQRFLCIVLLALIAACATPPQTNAPSQAAIDAQQKRDRATASLAEGLKFYDAGNNEGALKSLLVALDSAVLTLPEQLNARKHMAFIHCLSGRQVNCKEEFEKAFALDAKFDLAAAEAGHPTWGPVFKAVKADVELRRSGRTAPPTPKAPSKGETLITDGVKTYDDAVDYNKAIKSFTDALAETLALPDQIKAHKYMAFSYCLTNRMTLCRGEFQKIFDLKPDFDLEPAEAGHPSWGPSFRAVKPKKFTPATLVSPLK